MERELALFTATQLIELLSKKQISPVELVHSVLKRIELLNPKLNAFLAICAEDAIRNAKHAEKAILEGVQGKPLIGLPIPIKDTQMTKGIVTTNGSLVFKNRVPNADAAVVEKLKAAGAIIIGKTNAPEFGLVGACDNLLGEPGRNPWNLERTCGGSSGGSAAAVASGISPIALGTDGGGSIRIPASFCGIYGIKPSRGRVSGFTGVDGPPEPNDLMQNGPITKTVDDAALVLDVISGYDQRDSNSLPLKPDNFTKAVTKDIKGLKIAWSQDLGFARVTDEVKTATYAAAKTFEQFGCIVEEVPIKMPDPYDTFGPMKAAETYKKYGEYLKTRPNDLTKYAKFYLKIGEAFTVPEYIECLGLVKELKATIRRVFQTYDLILTPATCFTAPKIEEFPGSFRNKSKFPQQFWNGAFTKPFNVTGHPAASVPVGFSAEGLPIGLQIVGQTLNEASVLSASATLQRSNPWLHNWPTTSCIG